MLKKLLALLTLYALMTLSYADDTLENVVPVTGVTPQQVEDILNPPPRYPVENKQADDNTTGDSQEAPGVLNHY